MIHLIEDDDYKTRMKRQRATDIVNSQMLSKLSKAKTFEEKREIIKFYNPFFYTLFEDICLQNDKELC